MNISDYQRCAERTIPPEETSGHLMVNAALGLCGEAAEIGQTVTEGWAGTNDDDMLSEAGDLLWYVAQMCRSLGKSIASVPPEPATSRGWGTETTVMVLYRNTGAIADMVKKRVFHERPLDPIVMMESLQTVVGATAHLLGKRGMTIEQALDRNEQKLRQRHPDGFTYETANARRDEAP